MVKSDQIVERLQDKSAGTPNGGKSAPISAHPLFPAIVALWFATLLGLGCLVLPIDLFERIVSALGIPSVVPAAAPPLGITAQLAIACAAAILGGAIGFLIAQRVGAARESGEVRMPVAASPTPFANGIPVKRPISAMEELGSDGLDEPVAESNNANVGNAPTGRRRALSLTDESSRNDYAFDAPLPGGNAAAHEAEEISGSLDDVFAPDILLEHDHSEQQAAAQEHQPEPQAATSHLTDRALADLGMVELVERFAIALQAHGERRATANEDQHEARRIEEEWREHDRAELERKTLADDAGEDTAETDSEPVHTPEPFQFKPLEPLPEFLRPVAADHGGVDFDPADDDDDDTADLSMPFATEYSTQNERDYSAEQSTDDLLASLLAVKKPRAAAGRYADFDDDATAPAAETEATPIFKSTTTKFDERELALRDALYKLQRISGAA